MAALGGIFILAGLALLIVGFIALIRPLPSLWLPTRKAAALALLGSLVSCGVGGSLVPKPTEQQLATQRAERAQADAKAQAAERESKAAERASALKETAKVRDQAKTDVLTLWGGISEAAKQCDNANNAVIKVLETSNVFSAYEAADRGADICRETWSSIRELSVPSSVTGENKDKLEKALETCENAYLFRQMSLEKMRDMLDEGIKPSGLQAYKQDAQTAQMGVLACVGGVMQVAGELGVDLKSFTA